MVYASRQGADEDAVNGQIFHLFADGTDGEDVHMMTVGV
jgi:hypothetical protein